MVERTRASHNQWRFSSLPMLKVESWKHGFSVNVYIAKVFSSVEALCLECVTQPPFSAGYPYLSGLARGDGSTTNNNKLLQPSGGG